MEPGRKPSDPVAVQQATGAASAALVLEGISKTFDGFRALDGASFSLARGEVHALLGENGAGKSTLMNVVAGLYAPDAGTVLLDDRSTSIAGPLDAQRLGIGMVHQHFKLVKPFNAVQNIALSVRGERYGPALSDIRGRVTMEAAKIGFSLDLDRPVGTLSIAEQQRVEILKVLVAGANILILDEPTAVLTDEESERLLETLRSLAAAGSAIVLVTHKLREAMSYCDRITVMRGGKTVDTVASGSVSIADLTTMIVGSQVHESQALATEIGEPVLEVDSLRVANDQGYPVLDGASFNVRSGEIYGIAGVGGNGQTEFADALGGQATVLDGHLRLPQSGVDLTTLPASKRRALGLALIPADRQGKALAGDLSVADNFAVEGVMRGRFGAWFRVSRYGIGRGAVEAVEAFDVQGVRSTRQRAALLSGGNAQKLVLAREFSGEPKIILAHSPSRGLDVRAAAAVHERLREARDRGAGIILISEDLDEIFLLSDRIGVMTRGRIAAEFDAPADRNAVGAAMVGHV